MMSRRITAGNDAPFRWAVKLQGKPFDLSGKDVKVYVINSRGEIPVARLTIEGNEVSGVFEGRYQTRLGEHSLSLRINEGRPEMKTAAVANVFELVQWSADAGGSDEGDVIVAPIVVESEITAGILAEYTKKDEFDSAVQTLSGQLEQKVNMEEGKTLSTNDFTNALKAKLESLSNYDDQELREAINAIESIIDTLIGDNASKKIESFNEIIRFLEGVEDTESLEGIVAGIQQSIAKKADASMVVSLAEQVQTLKTEVESQNELIEDLQNTKIDKEADDYYPQLSVGVADNLAGVDVVDSDFVFRRSGGGAITDGVARVESIKGNSVVWNQYITGTFRSSGNTTITNDGDVWAITPDGENVYPGIRQDNFLVPKGHKYLVAYETLFEGALSVGINMRGQSGEINLTSGGSWISDQRIINLTTDTNNAIIIFYRNAKSEIKVRNFIVIDLTKMFQAGNEPTTIEDFYQRIPQGIDINSYNEGEIIDMRAEGIKSVGVNQWDEEWEIGNISAFNGGNVASDTLLRSKNYIPIMPSIKYYSTIAFGQGVFFYDDKKEFITRLYNLSTIPKNARYMRFVAPTAYGTTYKNDICINLYDTEINGKYFPYTENAEDLSFIKDIFSNGMRSAGTAHDEVYYDKTTNKKFAVQRMGSVDLGTLNWTQVTASDGFKYFHTSKEISDAAYRNIGVNILNARHTPAKKGANEFADKDMRIFNTKLLYIRDDAYTDATSFKEGMQGVILYYELETPIVTEITEPFNLDYLVQNGGTEQMIATEPSSAIKADITYGFNAIGKIKELESLVAALRAKVGI